MRGIYKNQTNKKNINVLGTYRATNDLLMISFADFIILAWSVGKGSGYAMADKKVESLRPFVPAAESTQSVRDSRCS